MEYRQEKLPLGLFIGLATLDVIQLVDHLPGPNQKMQALDVAIAAGGPATNAAVAFSHLGGRSHLLCRVSDDATGKLIRSDLQECGVHLLEVSTDHPNTVASILVQTPGGDRSVISAGDGSSHMSEVADVSQVMTLAQPLNQYPVIQVDGYQADLAIPILEAFQDCSGIAVMDAGSFKPATPSFLRLVDCVVTSADFAPPGTAGPADVFDFLHDCGVHLAAMTRGPDTILFSADGVRGEVAVTSVNPVVDTLGAGDFFHGAFSFALSRIVGQSATDFQFSDVDALTSALRYASRCATASITSFGSRMWLKKTVPCECNDQ